MLSSSKQHILYLLLFAIVSAQNFTKVSRFKRDFMYVSNDNSTDANCFQVGFCWLFVLLLLTNLH